MAISDTPDRTYVLERGCGVSVGKGTIFGTTINDLPRVLVAVSQFLRKWDCCS